MICNLPGFSAEKEKVTLSFTGDGGGYPDCYVQIGDKIYDTIDTFTDVVVDVGTEVLCCVSADSTAAQITLNGEEQSNPYTYIAAKNATIKLATMSYTPEMNENYIEIIEEPVTLTLEGKGGPGCYITVNGTTYNTADVIKVSQGQTVYCYVHDDAQSGSSAIKLNGVGVGVELSDGFGNYEYNYAAQNATITLSFTPMGASMAINET